ADGQLRVVRRVLGEVAHRAPARERMALRVVSCDAHLARGGRKDARQDAHGGGLAGAVRTEEPDDLSLADGEADPAHGLDRAEALPAAPPPDPRRRPHAPASAPRRTPGASAATPPPRRVASEKSWSAVSSLGTATTRSPAARAARTPRGVSSTATHSGGVRPSAAAAVR